MHALLAVIDANNVGDKLSENVIGLEVTKDIKFLHKEGLKEQQPILTSS